MAYASAPSSTFTISGGVYPGAPSYTIWREGSEYFAKDANGLLTYSGTNASQIIQSSLDNGYGVFLLNGAYDLLNTVSLNSRNWLYGENREATWLYGTCDPLIKVEGQNYVGIGKLTLDGLNKTGNGIIMTGTYLTDTNGMCTIENIKIIYCATAMHLSYLLESVIRNVRIESCGYGIYFAEDCVNVFCSELDIINLDSFGIYVTSTSQKCEGLMFSNSLTYNCSGSLGITDGLLITFSQMIFDFGNTEKHVEITGGTSIYFTDCWFSGNVALGGYVYVSPFIAPIIDIKFTSCDFAWNKYYGLDVENNTNGLPHMVTVENCDFNNNGQVGDGGDIYLYYTNFTKITSSNFRSTAKYNIVEVGSVYCQVTSSNAYGSTNPINVTAGTKVNLCYNGTTWIP